MNRRYGLRSPAIDHFDPGNRLRPFRQAVGGFLPQAAAAVLLFALLSARLVAGSFEKDFAVVFIDAQTEAKYGAFPIDRALIAQAVERVATNQAKAVVLKFFYDKPGIDASDRALAAAIGRIPTALQARLDDTEPVSNPLLPRFFVPKVSAKTVVSGTNGWLPLPRLSEQARYVGFVDFAATTVPMLENYRGRTVKSLVLCALELAAGEAAVIEPGKQFSVGHKVLRLDGTNQIEAKLPPADMLSYIPFHAVLDGSAPASQFAGKVIIIGYDGSKIPELDVGGGRMMKAHRLFVHVLKSLYEQMAPDI